jgi:hypothetical protein
MEDEQLDGGYAPVVIQTMDAYPAVTLKLGAQGMPFGLFTWNWEITLWQAS